MISFEEAYSIVLNQSNDYGSESVPIINAIGRVLAEDVYADRDFPPYKRAMKNGIALNFDAIENGRRSFEIRGILAAGKPTFPFHETGDCIEIMSGAVVPFEADTVIRYEDLSIEKDIATVHNLPTKGQNINLRGSDKLKGENILKKHKLLSAAEMGILSSIGQNRVLVKKMPRVAVIATGKELVKINDHPLQHQIRRSNEYSLHGALERMCITPMLLHVEDDKDLMRQKLSYALESMDVLLLSGGISAGKFDFIPEVLGDLGVDKLFGQVAQEPGKPFWFGNHKNANTVVFSFPGNPVSTFANFHIYFRDWLHKSLGLPLNKKDVLLDDSFEVSGELTQIIGVNINWDNGIVFASKSIINNPGDLISLSKIDGFIVLSPVNKSYQKGETVPFIPTRKII